MKEYSFVYYTTEDGNWTCRKQTLPVIDVEVDGKKWQEYDTSACDLHNYGHIESMDLYLLGKLLSELPPVYQCKYIPRLRIVYLDFLVRHGLVTLTTTPYYCISPRGEYLLYELCANPPKPRTAVFPLDYNLQELEYPDKYELVEQCTGTQYQSPRCFDGPELFPGVRSEYNYQTGNLDSTMPLESASILPGSESNS